MTAPTHQTMDWVHLFYMVSAGLSCGVIAYYVRRGVVAIEAIAGIK